MLTTPAMTPTFLVLALVGRGRARTVSGAGWRGGRGKRKAHRDASFVRGALLPVALAMAAEVGLGVELLSSKVELGTSLNMLPTDAADELVAEAVADSVSAMSDEAALGISRLGQRLRAVLRRGHSRGLDSRFWGGAFSDGRRIR